MLLLLLLVNQRKRVAQDEHSPVPPYVVCSKLTRVSRKRLLDETVPGSRIPKYNVSDRMTDGGRSTFSWYSLEMVLTRI